MFTEVYPAGLRICLLKLPRPAMGRANSQVSYITSGEHLDILAFAASFHDFCRGDSPPVSFDRYAEGGLLTGVWFCFVKAVAYQRYSFTAFICVPLSDIEVSWREQVLHYSNCAGFSPRKVSRGYLPVQGSTDLTAGPSYTKI